MASPAKRRRVKNGKIKHALWQDVSIEAAPCHYCGKLLRFREATMDHRIPKSKGGRTEVSNMVIACEACNREKDDSTDAEYWTRVRIREDMRHKDPDAEIMGAIYT